MRALKSSLFFTIPSVFLALAAVPVQAQQESITVVAVLNGGDVAPAPVLTAAWAYAELTLDMAKGEATVSVDVFNLPTNLTGAHVHIGSPGMAGPVLFDLRPTSRLAGDITLSGTVGTSSLTTNSALGIKDVEDALESIIGLATYIDIHAEGHGDGEIRGWLIAEAGPDSALARLRAEALRLRQLRLQRR